MAAFKDGPASSRKGRGGRSILSLRTERPPETRSQLPNFEPVNVTDFEAALQRFEAALWSARNRWDIERRRAGIFGRRVTRREAHALLAKALRELEPVQ